MQRTDEKNVSLAGPYALAGVAIGGAVLFEVMNAVRRYSTGNAITGQIANVLNRLANVETATAVGQAVGVERQRYADVHYVHQPHVGIQGGVVPFHPRHGCGPCGPHSPHGFCGSEHPHYGHEFGGYIG